MAEVVPEDESAPRTGGGFDAVGAGDGLLDDPGVGTLAGTDAGGFPPSPPFPPPPPPCVYTSLSREKGCPPPRYVIVSLWLPWGLFPEYTS